MGNLFKLWQVVALSSAVAVFFTSQTGNAAIKGTDIPLPEATVTKTSDPPTIDGKMSPGEWDEATAGTGFHVREGYLGHNQNVFWVTYDEEYIYVCFKNYRAPSQRLVQKSARRQDQGDIVGDDSNEIWITPPSTPQETYQMMFNTYPAVWDVKYVPAVGHRGKGWSGDWEMASSESKAYWVIEAKAPIKAFGKSQIEDGSTWRALFTADLLRLEGGKFRRWGPWVTGGFKDFEGHDKLHFDNDSAILQVLDVESILAGDFNFPVAVTGPKNDTSKVTVKVRVGPEVAPSSEDLVVSKTVTVKNRQRKKLTFEGNVQDLSLPKHKEYPTGICEISAVTDQDRTIYSHVFRFRVDGYHREPPDKLLDSPYETPFGLEQFHAPLNEKLFVRVDRLYMDQRDKVASGSITLIDTETDQVKAETEVEPFCNDYSRTKLDISGLKLPVVDTEAWDKQQTVAEKNQRRKKLNKKHDTSIPLLEDPGPDPNKYRLVTTLYDKKQNPLAKVEKSVSLTKPAYEWLNHDIGISEEVIDPWEPLDWNGKRISMWNKSYRLNGLGLAENIRNDDRKQLSEPMQLVAVMDGEKRVVQTGAPTMKALNEARANLTGNGRIDDLNIRVDTKVAFDGYVRNRMKLIPEEDVDLQRLSLVVRMPEEEAPVFCSTAGGWAATYSRTPEKWSSKRVASGSRVGSFVPYVLLTDSMRGFCWFADNDEGWAIDPNGDAVTIRKNNGIVTLKVNFVQKPVTLKESREIVYGWMVTPQKPQPEGFRAGLIDNGWAAFPKCPWTVFYADLKRRVLWAYYSSPYPTDMEKSRQMIESKQQNSSKVNFCVGKTGDSLGHYEDYKGRDFSVLKADWSVMPGKKANGKVTRAEGPNDYEIWHWDRWIRHGGLSGVYFDINYLSEEWNTLSGTAYKLPDGRVQPGYSYMGQRQHLKRLRYLFDKHGKSEPNIWLHTTSGHAVYAWLADVIMEGENVSPTGRDHDYIDAYPAARALAIGRGRNIGAAPFLMFQIGSQHEHYPFLAYQFIGWTRLHDIYGGFFGCWTQLAAENEMWRSDMTFHPYWKSGWGVQSDSEAVKVSAHTYPRNALLWIVNKSHSDKTAKLKIDLEKLGLQPGKVRVFDAETSRPLEIKDGELRVSVPARLWRGVRLKQPQELSGDQTFIASFDNGIAAADEALGHRYAMRKVQANRRVIKAVPQGRDQGLAVELDKACRFDSRHHVNRSNGRVRWDVKFGNNQSGKLFAISPGKPADTKLERLKVKTEKGKIALSVATPSEKGRKLQWQTVAQTDWQPESGWHDFAAEWKEQSFSLSVDGTQIISAELPAHVPIRESVHGLERLRARVGGRQDYPARISFGPFEGSVLDNVLMACDVD